ncbi:hypothetical protein GFER_16100 [Geoalkalibacter ferrihydriticus DSM 17813]|uniref:ATP-grasp domain-containing protein n=1 Tax=Geoalkalibacter ferrihydriticus DSM 17813 TaxID=1121915 RepID=A0A0C2DQ19_9BACT|nr:hypothetical protein GFER_16100 [Geoalkalibacter ferrihydriticus DSM 17813]
MLALGGNFKKKPFIVPATDEEVLFLYKNSEIIEKYYTISNPKKDIVENVIDKFNIQDLLKFHGFTYPKTALLSDGFETDLKLDYPCIIKSASAGDWKNEKSSTLVGESKAVVVNDAAELALYFEKFKRISPRLIAQEIIEPAEGGIFSFCSYSDRDGKVLHGFVTQKLIQYPEGFGTAVLCQTVDDNEVYELGRSVIERLGADGVCETEIIRDARTGKLIIIEINTRHWMQHRLSTRLGVNYSLLDFYYRTGNDEKVREFVGNANGRPRNFIWFDDVGFMIYVVKNLFQPRKCKLREVWRNKWEFSLFSLTDLRPFWGCVWQKVSKFR